MNFKIMQTLYTFDKSKTTLMKAVLPFIIIIHHLSNHFLDTAWIHPFYYAGISVVILFFFISGYGIIASYLKNPHYFDGFFKKRFLKVLLPYLFILALWVAFNPR